MKTVLRSIRLAYHDRSALVADIALWLVLSVPVLAGSPVGPVSVVSWWRPVALLPLAVAVVLARRHPLWGLGVAAALSLADAWFFPTLFVVSYLAGKRSSRERSALFVFAGILVLGSALLLAFPGAPGVLNGVPLLAAAVMPWLVGRYRRLQRELIAAGWERAANLEREQHEVADRARLRERWRIAQDIHDQLGHDLSLLALRAGVIEMAGEHDERVRAAAAEIREGTTQAVERLHDVIGVLREEAEPTEGGPVAEDVGEIVARARRSGIDVTLTVTGEDTDSPPLVEQAARWIVREALTNVTKHAAGAAVAVEVERTAKRTKVTVSNAAAPGTAPARGRGSGLGLAGLGDRVRALDGTFDAGRDGGGFRVQAVLPHGGELASARPGATAGPPTAARRQVRRSLVAAAVAPLALATVLIGAIMAYFAEYTEGSVLGASAYAGLTPGADRASIRPVLPAEQITVREVGDNPAPSGTRCEYYRTRNGDLFESEIPVYRLCFGDGRLVSKSKVRAELT